MNAEELPIKWEALVEALCKVPGTNTHLGRTTLLLGIPTASSLERSEGNVRQDINLLVQQLISLYREGDNKCCLLILIENAINYVSGVTLEEELKELYTQVTNIVKAVHIPKKQLVGRKHDPIVMDCEDEVGIYRQMVIKRVPQRMLLIKGTAKMGKSHLMREFRRIALQEQQILCALVDIRTRGQSYKDVLKLIVQEIGYPYFKHYEEKIQQLPSRSANPVINPNDIMSLLLAAQSRGDQSSEDQRNQLTRAFIEDLRLMPYTSQIVLLLDAFEEAHEDTQRWIYQELLIDLYKLPNVLTVIAGRQLLEPEITWQDIAITTELKAVTVKDYQAYRDNIGATELEENSIEVLHKAFEGRPGDFAEVVKNFIPKGGAA